MKYANFEEATEEMFEQELKKLPAEEQNAEPEEPTETTEEQPTEQTRCCKCEIAALDAQAKDANQQALQELKLKRTKSQMQGNS